MCNTIVSLSKPICNQKGGILYENNKDRSSQVQTGSGKDVTAIVSVGASFRNDQTRNECRLLPPEWTGESDRRVCALSDRLQPETITKPPGIQQNDESDDDLKHR